MAKWLCGWVAPSSPLSKAVMKEQEKPASQKHNERSRDSAFIPNKLGFSSPPKSCQPLGCDLEAAAVTNALRKVGQLVERFTKLRIEATRLKSITHALQLLVDEWPMSFACLHILSRELDQAYLLGTAMSNDSSASMGATAASRALISFPRLLCTHDKTLAVSWASRSGFYCWHDEESPEPVPPDYDVYVSSGAKAVSTVVVSLPRDYAAVLTVGFMRGAGARHVSHELWTAYLKIVTAGMSPFMTHPSIPQYLQLAMDLKESRTSDEAITVVLRHMRELAAQAGNPGLWFRLALMCEDRNQLVLCDLPPEPFSSSQHCPRSSMGQRSYSSSLELETLLAQRLPLRPSYSSPREEASYHCRLASLIEANSSEEALDSPINGRNDSMRSDGGISPAPTRPLVFGDDENSSSVFSNQDSPGLRSSDRRDTDTLCPASLALVEVEAPSRGQSGKLTRTELAVEECLMRHVLDTRQLGVVSNVQKMMNRSGNLAADMFSVQGVRPPASVLILPLLADSDAPTPFTDSPYHGSPCFGAVYCMSGLPTVFEDVKLRLFEAVCKVVAPQLMMSIRAQQCNP